MHYPYTESWSEAAIVAQSSLAIVMTAIVVARPIRPKVASALFLGAVWIAALLPIEPTLMPKFGVEVEPGHAAHLLRIAAMLATAAFVVAKPWQVALLAPLGQAALWWLCSYLVDSDLELGAAHLAWFGALYGIYDRLARHAELRRSPGGRRDVTPPQGAPRRSYLVHDLVLFAIATAVGALVSSGVLYRFPNSGDEWANTFQADLFAHFKAYGTPPSCPGAFQNYWVFYYMGRAFSQYTPGWPLVMAPFQRVGLVWMATPVVSGFLAAGVAALSRRIARGMDGISERGVAAAGIAGALAVTFCASQALSAGARYPHTLVCAAFAWAVELVARIARDEPSWRAQWWLGVVFGATCALLLATRPTDGATLGVGLFAYFVYALIRRRIRWRAFVGTALGFGLLGGLTLVILRLQLGVWFETGYALATQFWSFAEFKMSAPPPELVKRAVPLGAMTYCYWPCAPALGFIGLFAARRANHVTFMLTVGALALTTFYSLVEFGRTTDAGFGPRYQLPIIVCVGAGVGAALGPLFAAGAQRFAARAPVVLGGAPAVAATVIALATAQIAWFLYPVAWNEAHSRTAVHRAIAAAGLHHAVVAVRGAEVPVDPRDYLLDFDDIDAADVLVVHDQSAVDMLCLRSRFRSRRFYRGGGVYEGKLTPM